MSNVAFKKRKKKILVTAMSLGVSTGEREDWESVSLFYALFTVSTFSRSSFLELPAG